MKLGTTHKDDVNIEVQQTSSKTSQNIRKYDAYAFFTEVSPNIWKYNEHLRKHHRISGHVLCKSAVDCTNCADKL